MRRIRAASNIPLANSGSLCLSASPRLSQSFAAAMRRCAARPGVAWDFQIAAYSEAVAALLIFISTRPSTHPHKTSSENVTKKSHDFGVTKNRQSGNVKWGVEHAHSGEPLFWDDSPPSTLSSIFRNIARRAGECRRRSSSPSALSASTLTWTISWRSTGRPIR